VNPGYVSYTVDSDRPIKYITETTAITVEVEEEIEVVYEDDGGLSKCVTFILLVLLV